MNRTSIRLMFRSLNRKKLFVILNVIGLSIGIAVCWVTYRIVDFELSTDKGYKDSDRIFQLVSDFRGANSGGGMGAVSQALYPLIRDQISGAEQIVPLFTSSYTSIEIPATKRKTAADKEEEIPFVRTTPDYFKVVPYHWLAGDLLTALDGPQKIVITAKRAREYFPSMPLDQVLGKTIIYDDTIPKTVSGVVDDLHFPTSLTLDEFTPLMVSGIDVTNWGVSSADMMLMKVAQRSTVNGILKQINGKFIAANKESFEKYHYSQSINAVPIREMHFMADYASPIRKANKSVMMGLAGVAFFILLLAAINYVNISTAQIPQRAKEIGIRKTMGSSPRQIIGGFIGETFVITLLAALLAVVLAGLGIRLFSDFFPLGISGETNYGGMAFFGICLITVLSFCAGICPAWLSAGVKTVAVLKGQTFSGTGGYSLTLRKSLIVFQFLIAQIFIVGSFIAARQLHYMLNKDLGFDKEAVILFNVHKRGGYDSAFSRRKYVLLDEIRQRPDVISASLGDPPMQNSMSGMGVYAKTKAGKLRGQLNIKYADTAYLSVYKMHLLAGRNLSFSDTVNEYLINEAAVRKFGFRSPEEAIGKLLFKEYNNAAFPIVGVVGDYHQFGFHSPLAPAAIVSANQRSLFNIRLRSGPGRDYAKTVQGIGQEWKSIYPELGFDYHFYDDTLAEIVEPDERTATLINLATSIAILISCLGLFSLSTLVSYQRTKEIGIRKVLGSSVARIARLLSMDFIRLILIAVVIATPVAWWLMEKWLQDFAFAVRIEWWMFFVTGAIAVSIALLTVSFHSIRAAFINPVKTLRTE